MNYIIPMYTANITVLHRSDNKTIIKNYDNVPVKGFTIEEIKKRISKKYESFKKTKTHTEEKKIVSIILLRQSGFGVKEK